MGGDYNCTHSHTEVTGQLPDPAALHIIKEPPVSTRQEDFTAI
jgi:hypothetical protein